jgi:hypothetical protein
VTLRHGRRNNHNFSPISVISPSLNESFSLKPINDGSDCPGRQTSVFGESASRYPTPKRDNTKALQIRAVDPEARGNRLAIDDAEACRLFHP